MKIAVIVLLSLIFICFLLAFICYLLAFYSSNKKRKKHYKPDNDQLDPIQDFLHNMIEELRNANYEEVSTKSFDGLNLKGRLYLINEGAPLIICFHGYRSCAINDCGGAYRLAKTLKYNLLLPECRGLGISEGHLVTFGIKERYDAKSWVDYAVNRFGDEIKIELGGVSMGASIALSAANIVDQKHVRVIVADCGFTSPKDIIKKVITKDLKLPTFLYFFVKLGALVYGHFNLEESSSFEETEKTKIPTLFFHGEEDRFVPHEMSLKMYDACNSEKQIHIFENAGHGLSYLVDEKEYTKEYLEFVSKYTK